MASNGGTEFDAFLRADDEAGLTAALDSISTETFPCTLELDEPDAAADPDVVNFYFDRGAGDEVVPHNEGCARGDTGWSWTDGLHTSIYFCDATCDDLQEGVESVSARFGCPTEELI